MFWLSCPMLRRFGFRPMLVSPGESRLGRFRDSLLLGLVLLGLLRVECAFSVYPGRQESNYALPGELLEAATLDGSYLDDQDSDGSGWMGLICCTLGALARTDLANLHPVYRSPLVRYLLDQERNAAYIVWTDDNGFFYLEGYATRDAAQHVWDDRPAQSWEEFEEETGLEPVTVPGETPEEAMARYRRYYAQA